MWKAVAVVWGSLGLAIASPPDNWVPVICAGMAAVSTVTAAWLGIRRNRGNPTKPAPAPAASPEYVQELESRLFLAMSANLDLTEMVVERDASLSEERRKSRLLRRQLRDALGRKR